MTFSGSDLSNVLGTAIAAGAVVRVVDSTMGKGSRRGSRRRVVYLKPAKSVKRPAAKKTAKKATAKRKKSWSVWDV